MSMHALRAEKGTTKAHLKVIELPEIDSDEVLIKVRSAILAPDVFALLEAGRISQAPTTLGHKVAGTIEQVGGAIQNLKVGQRVRLEPNLNCGDCAYCRTDRDQMCSQCGIMGFFALGSFPRWAKYHPGGLAEYVRAPASQVDVLPDNVSFDAGAKVHDLSNALRAFKLCALPVGSTVLITAATGAMGACCLKLAPFFGVSRLILVGRSQTRVEAITVLTSIPCDCIGLDTLGDDWTSSRALGRKVCEIAPGGIDGIIDFSPSGQDLWQVTDGLTLGGSMIVLGGNWSVMPIPARVIGLKCWRVIGSRNHSRGDSKTVLELLKSGQLDAENLVAQVFKLQDIEKAIAQLKDRSQPSWMLVIRP